MYGDYLQEAKLFSYAYDLEQEIQPHTAPQFILPRGTGKPLPR